MLAFLCRDCMLGEIFKVILGCILSYLNHISLWEEYPLMLIYICYGSMISPFTCTGQNMVKGSRRGLACMTEPPKLFCLGANKAFRPLLIPLRQSKGKCTNDKEMNFLFELPWDHLNMFKYQCIQVGPHLEKCPFVIQFLGRYVIEMGVSNLSWNIKVTRYICY